MRNSKEFLIDRILDQAKFEGVSLTDIEIRMLRFTEATSGSKDLEAAKIFERDYSDEEYEEKIANLIRHAYERDKQSGKQEEWDESLVRVAGRDLYLNVMIDRSGIDKDPYGLVGDWRFLLYAVFPWALTLTTAVLIGFSPLAAKYIRSDGLRLVIAICVLATPFLILRNSRHRHKPARKRSPSEPD